jgi:hypothetical protein
MDPSPIEWAAFAAVTLVTLHAMLRLVSSAVRNEIYVHDTKVAVRELREAHDRRLRELRGLPPDGPLRLTDHDEAPIDVDPIDDTEGAPAQAA